MMECADYRRAILADPHHPTADMRSHAASCHDCGRYTERVLAFERLLERALRVPVGAAQDSGAAASAAGTSGGNVIPLRSPRSPPGSDTAAAAMSLRLGRGWFAAAASVLVAVFVAGGLWLALPRPSLAADVVSHMAGEPGAWSRTDVPVSPLEARWGSSRLAAAAEIERGTRELCQQLSVSGPSSASSGRPDRSRSRDGDGAHARDRDQHHAFR